MSELDDGGPEATAPLFRYSIESSGSALTIELIGELDLASAAALEDPALDTALADGITQLTIDLRRLDFLDASGLRALLVLQRRLSERAPVTLVPGPPHVHRVLVITGIAEHLSFTAPPATPHPTV